MSVRSIASVLSLLFLGCAVATARQPGNAERNEYTISLPAPQTQTVNMSLHLREVDVGEVRLVLPTWRPGRYILNEHAGAVRWARASTPGGRELPMEKKTKNTWVVRTDGSDEVVVEYQMYANQLGIRTMHVDDSHAFLDGSAVYMYWPERRDEPALVNVEAPDDWRISTGLERAPGARGDVFYAPDFDVLVDSPFEIGIHDVLEFEVRGIPHEIVIWQAPDDYDREGFIDDFAAITEVQAEMFGGLPYERYVFQVHATNRAGGATEHLNSTILQTSPDIFWDEDRYERWLSVVSHELFHVWNVKHVRPAGIKPYDYTDENYTKLLWVAEGTTSYYDDLMLVRAGIQDVDDYLDGLANRIEYIRDHPGAEVQSLEESSFDAWIKFNRRTPDSVNTTVSFYSKGALVSWLLDLVIRTESDGAASLDGVWRDLFAEFPYDGPGYTPDDFQRICESRAGTSLDWFFDAYVRSTDPLEYDPYLAAVGLRLEMDHEEEGEENGEDEPDAYLGIATRSENGFPGVRHVRADGPAYDAGVIAGDLLVSLNGRRLHGSLNDAIDRLEPGDPVTLTLSRDDVIREVDFVAAEEPGPELSLELVEDPTDAQRAAFQSWTGQPWPDEEAETEEAVAQVLDDLHRLAAEADGEAYFALFSDEAVFLGTDATERWTLDEFRAFAEPHFSKGRGWTYRVRDRWITVEDDTAWFDEVLDNERLGECRGSGVLVRVDGEWLLAQYNLAIPIPNALADDVVRRIREREGR